MYKFQEITIGDKALFDKYLKPFNPQASEITFTNFFMWRYYYRFKFTEINNFLCIIAELKEGLPYAFIPIGEISGDNFKNTVLELKDHFKQNNWELQFRKVTDNQLQPFREFVSEEKIQLDIDNFDYIYKSEDMIHLHGKKFDGKRNHINKFKKLYQYEYIPISKDNIEYCYKIMHDWCLEKEYKIRSELNNERLATSEIDNECKATSELLNNFHILGGKGALLMVDGKFSAFTIGEMLNSDTAVIHIEKGNSKLHGVYTYINQQFCTHEWQEAAYINREQDLGIEGLRKAKLSYNPVKMIKKYTVYVP